MLPAPTPWTITDLESLPAVPCPCGLARRGLQDCTTFPGTIHRTTITRQAQKHWHRTMTETYYILECSSDAAMELDDQLLPVRPGMCIVIPPGITHRAIGQMEILNIVLPKFDPQDEFLVDTGSGG
jgi:hypothetical protein